MKYALMLVLLAVQLAADINTTVYLPQVVNGGAWETTFTIVNLSERSPGEGTLHLWNKDGSAMTFPFVGLGSGSAVSVTLPPSGMITLTTTGDPNIPTTAGWADFDVTTANNVVISALMRQRVAGRNDFEAFVPSRRTGITTQVFLFDNGPANAGFAIMNAAAQNTGTVEMIIRDENGQILQSAMLSLSPKTQRTISLRDDYPVTAGKRGTVEFIPAPGGWFAVIGLRFNNNGPVTALDPMQR
ncbi:MAG TPA: hypothetical protein VN442_13240 [Bryobacteraceae bacterium]|nr:hypothetical protein [Bryobacteraceae bacterium]